ncbi:GNAT family N-acetyltransferase [Azotosporobacter soli]|uniref:GNAT family N-acetyltransferase n=1 Tax=Azotosporobacter soli TaxID=3055040 RepID=UPI0031FEA9AE
MILYDDKKLLLSEGDEASAAYIRKQLIAYNMASVPRDGLLELEPLQIVLKDEAGTIVGGINANTIAYWKKCRIDIFWIDENYRKTGYGSILLKKVEEIARDRGCTVVQLDTYSFQAPAFYQKNGYEVFGAIENSPTGHTQYFLKKSLLK